VAAWRTEGARVLEGDTEVCRVNEQRRDYWLDARLISAAPELLAACKAILASLRSGGELDAENPKPLQDRVPSFGGPPTRG